MDHPEYHEKNLYGFSDAFCQADYESSANWIVVDGKTRKYDGDVADNCDEQNIESSECIRSYTSMGGVNWACVGSMEKVARSYTSDIDLEEYIQSEIPYEDAVLGELDTLTGKFLITDEQRARYSTPSCSADIFTVDISDTAIIRHSEDEIWKATLDLSPLNTAGQPCSSKPTMLTCDVETDFWRQGNQPIKIDLELNRMFGTTTAIEYLIPCGVTEDCERILEYTDCPTEI